MTTSPTKPEASANESTRKPIILVLGGGSGALQQLEPRLRDHGVTLAFASCLDDAQRLGDLHQPSLCAVVIDTDFEGRRDPRGVLAGLRSKAGGQLPAIFLGESAELTPRDLAFVIAEPLASLERTCRLLLSLVASARSR